MPTQVIAGVRVHGGFNRQEFFWLFENKNGVAFCESLWYDPHCALRRKKFERRKAFLRRVKKELGFVPKSYRTWKRLVMKPLYEAMMKDDARWARERKHSR